MVRRARTVIQVNQRVQAGIVDPHALAYPVLLAASYGVYRLGRRRDARRSRAFTTVRLSVQGVLIGLVAAVCHRSLEAGALVLPWGALVPALAIPALLGLVYIDVYRVLRPAAAGDALDAPAA